MAFIGDDMTITADSIVDPSLADQALNHRNVQAAVQTALSGTDLADVLGLDAEEQRQLRDPLVEERLAVNQNQRVPASRSDKIGPNHSLADTRRCDEDTSLMRKEVSYCLLLNRT